MKNLLSGGLALVALAACSGTGASLSPEACASAQKGVAIAEAEIAAYPDQSNVPAWLTTNLATAKAALPLLCPEPTTVVVKAD